jgi:hypothetical protein
MMMPLVPPVTLADDSVVSLASAITQPAAPNAGQLRVTPQKKKSVPPEIFELTNSVTGPQRAAAAG